jgi:hypothetical protein
MQTLDEKYGKLDWRLPEVHGLYWAEESIPLLEYDPEKLELFYHRMRYTAFKLMFERGKVKIYGDRPFYNPDVRWADQLDKIYVDLAAMLEGTDKFSVENARKNWMKRAIYLLHLYNREKQAREYYRTYVKIKAPTDPEYLTTTFEQFVFKQARDLFNDEGIKVNSGNIKGLIIRSLVEREFGDLSEAMKYENLSRRLYDIYEEENRGYEDRFAFPPYDQLHAEAVKEFREELEREETKSREESAGTAGED